MSEVKPNPNADPNADPEVKPVKPTKIKYKCSLCFYDAFCKDNIVHHIEKTKKCAEAEIIEIKIMCDYCDKPASSEMSKIAHEKICKTKKIEDLIRGLPFEEQTRVLMEKYLEQNKHIETMEKQMRALKNKYAREEEVNNTDMKNEHGSINAKELHGYCIYTLKRLYGDVIIPAIRINLQKRDDEAEAQGKSCSDPKSRPEPESKSKPDPKSKPEPKQAPKSTKTTSKTTTTTTSTKAKKAHSNSD